MQSPEITPHKHSHGGFPGGASGKESTCQCRRHGFDPWVGKIHWRRKWQSTPILLPEKVRGYRSLAGYSPQDYKESDTTKVTQQHANVIKLTKGQRQFDGTKSFQQTGLEQLNIHLQKKLIQHKPYTCYKKINSKCIMDLNVKCKTIKLLEDNIEENIIELGMAMIHERNN